MKRTTLALSAALGLMLALPASAQFQKPEDAIKYRKAAFTVMASHFGRLGPMAQGRVPFDAKVAADNIAIATTVSTLPFAGFGPGTDKGDTKAKPEIWTDADKFAAAAGLNAAALILRRCRCHPSASPRASRGCASSRPP